MKLSELKNHKIGMCVSGGLDSKTVTKRFIEEGLDVVCFSADLGQPDETDINNIIEKWETSFNVYSHNCRHFSKYFSKEIYTPSMVLSNFLLIEILYFFLNSLIQLSSRYF